MVNLTREHLGRMGLFSQKEWMGKGPCMYVVCGCVFWLYVWMRNVWLIAFGRRGGIFGAKKLYIGRGGGGGESHLYTYVMLLLISCDRGVISWVCPSNNTSGFQ